MAVGRHREKATDQRFAEKPRRRGRREEVVEILAEGLWALVCGGRGPGRQGLEPQEGEGPGRPSGRGLPTSGDASTG